MTRPSIPHAKSSSTGLHLCDDGAGSGALVLPGRGEDTDSLIVTGETVDSRLDENETELGVLVLAVALQVLSDRDGLRRQSAFNITPNYLGLVVHSPS